MSENDKICPIEFDDKNIIVTRSDQLLSNKVVNFTIPGKPFAKQRPRVSSRGRFSTIYTPKETIAYENLVKCSYYQSVGEKKLQGPINATIKGTFPIPKSVSKKQRDYMVNNEVLYTKKPDCDNMAKICLDALNGIAYDDDSQVCELFTKKVYGENPKVDITLREIE